ncbi:MAG: MBL fold metallo-hydrolase [Candidatus Thorarchaeota archaeon]
MKTGDIEIHALASESMGVRSLATQVSTPDIRITLDASAALALRSSLEPHPLEYQALEDSLTRIHDSVRHSEIVTISHYHYDHVRPGFTNNHFNFSSLEDLRNIYGSKIILAKDSRDMINPSQRRRSYYFQKDLDGLAKEIHWADGQSYSFGETKVEFSQPLPHGPKDTRLGYVLCTIVEHASTRFLFAPDVQGPIEKETLTYIIDSRADVAIVGGPPIYLKRFTESQKTDAFNSLITLAATIPILVVDHHLMRSLDWELWLQTVKGVSERAGNSIITMAELNGLKNNCLEAQREDLYAKHPPSEDFLNWTMSSDDYKKQNPPPY